MSEFFPPTEDDLRNMITKLKSQLEDDKYQDEWQDLAKQLETREKLLQEITIQNNIL